MKSQYKIFLFLLSFVYNNVSKSQSIFTGLIKYQREYSNKNIQDDSMIVIFDQTKVRISFFYYDSTLNQTKEDIVIWDFESDSLYSVDKYLKTYSVTPYPFGNPFHFTKDSAGCNYENISCIKFVDSRKLLAKKSSYKSIECKVSNLYTNYKVKDLVFFSVQPLIVQGKIVMEFQSKMKDGQVSRTYATKITQVENISEYFSFRDLKKTKL